MSFWFVSKSSPLPAHEPAVALPSSPSNTASDFMDEASSVTVSDLTSARRASTSLSPRHRQLSMAMYSSEGDVSMPEKIPPPPASLAQLRAVSAAARSPQQMASSKRAGVGARGSAAATAPATSVAARRGSVMPIFVPLREAPAEAQKVSSTWLRSVAPADPVEEEDVEVSPTVVRPEVPMSSGQDAVKDEQVYPVELSDDEWQAPTMTAAGRPVFRQSLFTRDAADEANPTSPVKVGGATAAAVDRTPHEVDTRESEVGGSDADFGAGRDDDGVRTHVRRATLPCVSNTTAAELLPSTTTSSGAVSRDASHRTSPLSVSLPQAHHLTSAATVGAPHTTNQGDDGASAMKAASLARSATGISLNSTAADGRARILVAARVRPSKTVGSHGDSSAAMKSASTSPSRVVYKRRNGGRANLRVDAARARIECVGAAGSIDTGKTVAGGQRSPSSPGLSSASPSSSVKPAAAAGRGALAFQFDTVLTESATQQDVMKEVGTRAVEQVLAGFNGTVLCYGQSGSGKTHTMYGPRGGRLSEADTMVSAAEGGEGSDVASNVGLAPRMLKSLFSSLEARQREVGEAAAADDTPFHVSIGAMEIYNEELRDLLSSPKLLKSLIAKKRRRDVQQRTPTRSQGQDDTDEEDEEEEDDEDANAPSVREDGDAHADSLSEPPPRTPERASMTSATKRSQSTPAGRHSYAKTTLARRSQTPTTTAANTTAANQSRVGGSASPCNSLSTKKRAKSANAVASSAVGRGGLVIRSGPSEGMTNMSVHVANLQSHHVANFEEAMVMVRAALRERRIGATRHNVDSSRAHMILFVRVRQAHVMDMTNTLTGCLQRRLQTLQAVLTLVDLAGSERVSRTGADGVRLREAQSINLSLSTLSTVIRRLAAQAKAEAGAATHSALSQSTTPLTHVPYRDSKLTRVLQDSFGGNAITFLLCHISSDACDFQESVSSLRFGSEAKLVKNRAVRNAATRTETWAMEKAALQKEFASMRSSLDIARSYTAWLERQLDFFSRQCMLLLNQQEDGTAAVMEGVAARIDMEKHATDSAVTPVQAHVLEVYGQLEKELMRQQRIVEERHEQQAASAAEEDDSLHSTEEVQTRSRRMSTSIEQVIVSEFVSVAGELREERQARAIDQEALIAAQSRADSLEEAVAEKDTIIQALQAALDERQRESDALREQQAADEAVRALEVIQSYGGRTSVEGSPTHDAAIRRAVSSPVSAVRPLRGETGKDVVVAADDVAELLADYRSGSDTGADARAASSYLFCAAEKIDVGTQTGTRVGGGEPSMLLPITSSFANAKDPLMLHGVNAQSKGDNTHTDGEVIARDIDAAPLVPLRMTHSWPSVDGTNWESHFAPHGATPPPSSLRASRQLWTQRGQQGSPDGTVVEAASPGRLARLVAGFRLAAALAQSEPNLS